MGSLHHLSVASNSGQSGCCSPCHHICISDIWKEEGGKRRGHAPWFEDLCHEAVLIPSALSLWPTLSRRATSAVRKTSQCHQSLGSHVPIKCGATEDWRVCPGSCDPTDVVKDEMPLKPGRSGWFGCSWPHCRQVGQKGGQTSGWGTGRAGGGGMLGAWWGVGVQGSSGVQKPWRGAAFQTDFAPWEPLNHGSP